MIGSFIADSMVQQGRRRTIIFSQLIALAGSILFFIENVWVMLAGKVIYGTGTGIAIVAIALYFSETIPAKRTGRYGFAINLGIVTGVTFTLLLGLLKPE